MVIDIKEFRKALEIALKDTITEVTSKPQMSKLGKGLADSVRKRTQLGYGVRKSGGKRERLKPLAESTKLQRQGKIAFRTNKKTKKAFAIDPKKATTRKGRRDAKALAKQLKPKLGSNTSPNKSNLTQSGRMLRSIGVLVTGIGRAVIGFNTRKRAQIAAFVSKQRPFFFATNAEERRVAKEVNKLTTQLVKRNMAKQFRN